MALSLVIAVPTFICSLLSFLATSLLAIFYVLFPPERHFRQALIVNLLVADWINSLNNTISGAVALARRDHKFPLEEGAACTANGWIGQFSVQAIDFNILVISFVVLTVVRDSKRLVEPPWKQVALICAIPWIPSLITSNIALGMNIYQPVSGNWCWIEPDLKLRYAFTHGWRIAIFAITIGIYTYIYIYLLKVYGKLHFSTGTAGSTGCFPEDTVIDHHGGTDPEAGDPRRIHVRSSIFTKDDGDLPLKSTLQGFVARTNGERKDSALTLDMAYTGPKQQWTPSARVEAIQPSAAQTRSRALRKAMLLNGYPILYIILWIPGIANRITEAVGVSPIWLKALGATTQLCGLANSVTYAWNDQLYGRVKSRMDFMRRRGRSISVLPSRNTSGLL